LAQGNSERRLQSVIEYRIARAIGKVGENDCVFISELGGLPRVLVVDKPAHRKRRDHSRHHYS
jgi:hypothetical protein